MCVCVLETNQSTRPKGLPVSGSVEDGEIELDIASISQNGQQHHPNSTMGLFGLSGKELRLNEPLDRDNPDISTVILQVRKTVLHSAG